MAKRKRVRQVKVPSETKFGPTRIVGPFLNKQQAQGSAWMVVHQYKLAKRSRLFQATVRGKRRWFVKYYGWKGNN
jgi:hypothetical protein